MKTRSIPGVEVRPGDMAHRRDSDLDPRPVEEVIQGTPRMITLRIGTQVTTPIPARWYRFTRMEED